MKLYRVISHFRPIGKQESYVFAKDEIKATQLVAKKLKIKYEAFTFECVEELPIQEGVITFEYLDEGEDELLF